MELESWTPALRQVPKRLLTFMLPPGRGVVPLRELRTMTLGFLVLLALLAAVLGLSGLSDSEPTLLGWLVTLAAAVGAGLGSIFGWRSRATAVVEARKEQDADRAYAARFSASAGLAMTPVLVAMVVGLWQGNMISFWIAGPVSLALLAVVAPWSRDIHSLQSRAKVDLVSALMTPRTWSARDEASGRRS